MMRKIYSNDKKEIYKDDKTGIEKTIYTKDPEHLEELRRRDWIQPYGPEEKEFFDRYRHLKKGAYGKIINKNEERQREESKNWEIEEYEKKQRAKLTEHNLKYKKYY